MKELDYHILLEVAIVQDSSKSINTRESTQFFDFLGDVGGFQGSMIIILYLLGEYFSSHLLTASLAGSLYLTKIRSPRVESGEQFEGGSKTYDED